jgi:hypothetical protein
VLAALLAGSAVPRPALASEEAEALVLPGAAFGGVVADLNGDGRREIVRLVPADGAPSYLAVEAWREVDGAWHAYPTSPALRRGVDGQAPHTWWRLPDRDGMLPQRVDEPARLLIWNDGQRERLLAATIGGSGLEPGCCLALHELVERDGELRVELVEPNLGPVAELHAADMTGDGVAELVLIGPGEAGEQAGPRPGLVAGTAEP